MRTTMMVTGRGNTADVGPTQLAGSVKAKAGLNTNLFAAVQVVVRPVKGFHIKGEIT